MKTFIRSRKGSILAYTLILLGIILAASISMMAASVTNLRSVSSNNQSINAFQIADSGSQAVVKGLKEATGSKLGDVPGVTCSGGDAIASKEGFLGGDYKVIFQDSDGKTLKCTDSISDVASVKSVGTYGDTARAVQVAVAAGGACSTPGQVVMVAKNTSDAKISSSDLSKISDFSQDVSRHIVGYSCIGSAGQVKSGTADFFSYNAASGSGEGFSVGTDGGSVVMACFQLTGCGAPSACDRGWALYGICTVDNS